MAEHQRLCASCGTANEEDARFCEGCGGSLARVCGTCGVEASAKARFCRGCGAPLDGQVAQAIPVAGPSRKTVTVMFADLAGSTSFEEKVDAETVREVMGRYHDLLRSAAARHRAGVTKYIGDGFMAVWGVPEIGPDDASHAVDAAVELQEVFVGLAAQVVATHGVDLALRVAVNTGEVVVGAGDADLVGDALNVGARLEAECPRGHVVVGEETWRSTRGRYAYESLGQVQVKGRSAPVALYQWLARQDDAADAAPFVGRADEARRLQAVLDDAVAAGAARLVTVIGDPGVGKSRLAAEFTGSQPDARLIEARCDVEATVALAPIVEVLRSRDLETDLPASIPERVRLLRDLNGLATGVAGSVEETFWALRRYVEVLASNGPVLLVFDDIQWADPLLLDLIEHLVEWVAEVPILVLALARPELREIRPNLVTVSRWVSEAIHLGGLNASATAELAAKVLGATRLPDELLRRLPASTGGNPLFVRELIGMLAHDGVLVEQPGGWRLTIDVDAITIPPTIHALLASRLERLDATDRRTLEIASVIGGDFSLGAVRALADSGAAGVKTTLDRLRRLELAQPSGAFVGDEPVWRFHHVLVRDVAYRRLLKSDRADLHERLADWFEAGGPSVAFDAEEMIARHLESTHTYRRELGTHDAHTGELALRSARHYAASARRALDRDELVSAGTQAARGAHLAADDIAVHADLLLTGCEAFLSAGDVAAGASLVDDLERIAGDALAPWATCYRSQFIVYTEPERLLEVEARLQGAIDEFGHRGDQAGLAKAHRVRAGARARLGRIGDCETDLFEALIAARQSGDHRQITAALGAAPSAALWGPSPVPKAGGRCLDVVRMQRMTTAAPSLEATSLRHLAVLELLRGRPDKARAMLADAREVVADLGLRHGLMETELFAGIIESMEGDPVAAEPHFRTALEGLDALGAGADAGLAAALLARSVLAQGRLDEADRYAEESERLAGRNLKTAIAWRSARAEILSAQGCYDESVTMARDAVAVAAGTDLVLDHALACLALSRVLAAAGNTLGAGSARDDADRLYAAKEVTSTVGRSVERAGNAVASAAPSAASTTSSRLAVTNESVRRTPDYFAAMRAHDVEGTLRFYADEFVYDDHRRISGELLRGRESMRAAIEGVVKQYSRFESRVMAVRGQRLGLVRTCFADDAGNESTTFDVGQIDEAGLITYLGRFDEDDFEGAYRELERRYFAGEGKAFAEPGAVAMDWVIAMNRGDVDRAFVELAAPSGHTENRSRMPFPDPSISDPATSYRDLETMVVSTRTWPSAGCWLRNGWFVVRIEREAVGLDGETYAWSWLNVSAVRDGRFVASCIFDVEDEDAAFGYAEERMRATDSRLALTNRVTRPWQLFWAAMRAHDADGALECSSDAFLYDDRRNINGDPIRDRGGLRAGLARILEQYTDFETRVLAVRGENLLLGQSRWLNDAGFETTHLHVVESGDDGRFAHEVRFDEDFESAYGELERRYYVGEGAPFADAGAVVSDSMTALNEGDVDRLFGELYTPDVHIENRSRTFYADRSIAEIRGSTNELAAMVALSRTWQSAVQWISPTWCVCRPEREAIGHDGEKYSWTWLFALEVCKGHVATMCVFEQEDEDAAFAYAEERAHASTSRLAVTNRASATSEAGWRAMQAGDVDALVAVYDDRFVYDDQRRLSGDPIENIAALRSAAEQMLEHFARVEWRTLAVRGERLHLARTRWSNDAGYETAYLHIAETDGDGRITYSSYFDEDDFEGAYVGLERRYYAGEGAPFAESGLVVTDYIIAYNQGDFDRFGELTASDLWIKNRSRSGFPDLSAAGWRTSLEGLAAMVTSSRAWISAMRWVSPTVSVSRTERESVGLDGEPFAWCCLVVSEIRDGRLVSMCQFELDDEEAAFAYAEERVRKSVSRLVATNRASQAGETRRAAMEDTDVDGAVACCSDGFVQDDRRRLSGDPIRGLGELRLSCERALAQYCRFEVRTLAVRGERLQLFWGRWSNEAGYESTHLGINEVDDDGRISYQVRFDEDDFEGAYRELDERYYAGEGAAYAEAGLVVTETVIALNQGDLDRVFRELIHPDQRFEIHSRSAFPDRSATDLRASLGELTGWVASMRTWHPAMCWLSPTRCVFRSERVAVGRDGENYAWTQLYAIEVREGRAVASCEFEVDDEEAAFAYAEDRIRAENPSVGQVDP